MEDNAVLLKMLAPRARLTLPNGESVEVERIGRGRYTTAWKNSHYVYLQTHEKDSSKDLLSHLPDNKHLPKVERLGDFGRNSPFRLYREPLYMPLTAKCGDAWSQFKELKRMREEAERNCRTRNGFGRFADAAELNYEFDTLVQDATYLSDEIKRAVTDLTYAAGNYGEYMIEITKKNCAVDSEGNLVLLDPVFDWREVYESRQKAMQKHRGY
jgi:hypothetical protein